MLDHLLETAGNPSLMTTELEATLADHAAGNYRVLMNLADELLANAVDRDLPRREALPGGVQSACSQDACLHEEALTMASIPLPDSTVLHHFPEAATLALLDAALAATELTLRAEHPTVDDVPLDPHHDIVPSLLTADLIVSRCAELRSLLDLYAAAVRRCVDFEHNHEGFS